MRTSTYYSESNANARTGSNASTPISHTRVTVSSVTVLGHPTSTLQPFIDTLTTKLLESALLLLAQIHHLSRSARQAAHSRIFILPRQLMSRARGTRAFNCPVNSVPGTLFTGQLNVFLQSTADLAAEAKRRHFVAISVPVVQQLPRAWHCAVHLQIGLHYATAEESRP